MDHVASLLLGLGSGGVFAALALALVITYRASGVVNFATGAMALYVAYTYAGLRRGELLVPIPGLPKTVDLGQELGFWPAVALSMVIAAALGALLYVLVFRPLRDAPQLAKAVASLGVLVVIQGLLAIRQGTNTVSVAAIFPAERWEFGSGHRAVRPVLPGAHRRRAGARAVGRRSGTPASGCSRGRRRRPRPGPTSAASRPTASRWSTG